MRRWWLILAALGCGPNEGEECDGPHDTYGKVCSGGRMLECQEHVWVDIGTSDFPDYADTAVLGGPACECEHPNKIECTYQDY